MATDTRITMKHIRRAGMCSSGARVFFIQNRLDWSDFLINGVSIEVIEATGDAMALQVAKVARDE